MAVLAAAAQGLADRVRAAAGAVTTAVDPQWRGPTSGRAQELAAQEAARVLRCAADVEEFADCLRRHSRVAADNASALAALVGQIGDFAGTGEMPLGGAL